MEWAAMIPALSPIISTFNNNLYSSRVMVMAGWVNCTCQSQALERFKMCRLSFFWHSISQNVRQRIWEMSHLSRTLHTMLNSNLSELSIGPDLFWSDPVCPLFLRKNISINLLQRSKLWIFEIGQALIEKLQIASQSHLGCCWSHHCSNQSRNVAYFITRY